MSLLLAAAGPLRETVASTSFGAGALIVLAALVAGAVGHAGARVAALSGPMHAPGARSSHAAPTPSGGGLGVLAGVAAGVLVLALARPVDLGAAGAARLSALIVILTGVAGLGLLDDLFDWPPRLKFALLGAAAAGTAFVAGAVESLPALGAIAVSLGPWLGLAGSTLWVFTAFNATNFMDGANGLAGGAVGVASAGLAVAAWLAGADDAALAAAALAGALAGFLPVNAPVARVFMGDAGSLFIGGWYAAAALLFVRAGPPGAVYVPPLLLLPILADTLLTMAWHVRHRAPILKPHRNHAYQVRIACGESHAAVAADTALRAGALALLGVAATAALLATAEPAWTLGALVLGVAVSAYWWRRDHAPRRIPHAGR